MEETMFSQGSAHAQNDGETTLTVHTGGPNDALLVPSGIETVVVNNTAERVIIPAGVEVIRLQGAQQQQRATAAPPTTHHSPPASAPAPGETTSYGNMIDQLIRAKRSVTSDATQTPTLRMDDRSRPPPAMSEKSLSLPSCPPTPPGSRSIATSISVDKTDFKPAAQMPPLAHPERTSDIFDDRTLEVDRSRVIRQQPVVPNGKAVRYSGTTEQEMKDPLVASRSGKMKHSESFGWREEFEHGEREHSRTFGERVGRFCADVLCCWVGL